MPSRRFVLSPAPSSRPLSPVPGATVALESFERPGKTNNTTSPAEVPEPCPVNVAKDQSPGRITASAPLEQETRNNQVRPSALGTLGERSQERTKNPGATETLALATPPRAPPPPPICKVNLPCVFRDMAATDDPVPTCQMVEFGSIVPRGGHKPEPSSPALSVWGGRTRRKRGNRHEQG